MPGDDRALLDAVARLAHLKAEHRGLVRRIAADPGMTPETRTALLEHVAEEEEEAVAALQALVGDASPGAPEQGLTVGSLRSEEPIAATSGVGSLRRTRS